MKNGLLKKLILLTLLLVGSITYAQQISGKVTDSQGPLPGVSVLVKGTTVGSETDFDGNYSLEAKKGDTLVFSFIGYKTKEVVVGDSSTVNVVLQDDDQQLDEVVVVGYGTTTVKDATGAVSAVKSEEFNKGVISSPEQLIQGKTAGVQISQTSGEPGAGIAIRIRGTNSVRSNNNPLFVVDGVPLSGDDTSGESVNVGFGTSAAKNPLNFLNPSDIESISILKDASATAIYGSRGANGVVIITTKSGSSGRNGVWEYASSVSASSSAKEYNLLSASSFLSETARLGLNVAERNFGSSTDWQDYVLRTTFSHNQNLSYSKNYGSGNFRITGNHSSQNGIVKKSVLDRTTLRLNLNQKLLDDKLKLSFQGSYSNIDDNSPPLSGSAGFRGDLLGAAYSANPTWSTNPDNADVGGQLSPATLLEYTKQNTITDRILINFSPEYQISDKFKAKVNLGYDYSDSENIAVASALGRNLDQGAFGNGTGGAVFVEVENRLFEATLAYKDDFGDSKLDLLGGFSYQDFNRKGRTLNGWGFSTTDLDRMGEDLINSADAISSQISGAYQQYMYAPNLSGVVVNRLFPEPVSENLGAFSGGTVKSLFVDTFDFTDELQSFFLRANYSIKDKYLFTVTFRADGSSRFGGNNKYGYFPSAAFAWKMTEEDFIGDNVSTLKLRLNWGITGNQDGLGYGNALRRTRYTGGDIIADGGNIDNVPGTAAVAFENPDLKWEETAQYGLGIDFGFNNDRFSGSFDFYRKETTDLLFRTQSAQPAVQPFQFRNLPNSKVVNQGFELNLGYDIIQSDDLTWNAGFNLSYNQNEVTSLDGQYEAGTIRGQGLSLAFAQLIQEGQPLFSYYLREFQGFDSVSGEPIQEDVQKFVGKSALPDFVGSFSSSVSYKNWTLAVFLNGQFGNYIYNNTANAFFTAGAFRGGRNVLPEVLTSGESLDAAAEVSTRFLESGDFIRLQNVTLSYDVPIKEEGPLKAVGLSLTGQNLFVITDYSGLDPEVSVSPAGGDLLNGLPVFGIDYTSFPNPRVFTLGVNLKF